MTVDVIRPLSLSLWISEIFDELRGEDWGLERMRRCGLWGVSVTVAGGDCAVGEPGLSTCGTYCYGDDGLQSGLYTTNTNTN